MNPIIVQKYGGATLSDPAQICQVAKRLAQLSQQGKKIVAVVSAMGKTTNQLIDLAHEISTHPNRRELDMLLSTGERVSMALLSIALNDLGCAAISFTGSQAGIMTDDSHVGAQLLKINAPRVQESLAQNKIVVLAGFQGVSPQTKEITTLGRGGTDITAVAMAAYLQAERCEILKDVESIYTADPKLVAQAKPIAHLNYQQLLEMTFWGAKFLNYRASELAAKNQVKLFIGPAANSNAVGTLIQSSPHPAPHSIVTQKPQGEQMEDAKILSINSFEQVLKISKQDSNLQELIMQFERLLTQNEISFPQILQTQNINHQLFVYLTAPQEQLKAIQDALKSQKEIQAQAQPLATVTCTCIGTTSAKLVQNVTQKLAENSISPESVQVGAMSISIFIEQHKRLACIQALHQLI